MKNLKMLFMKMGSIFICGLTAKAVPTGNTVGTLRNEASDRYD
jgi:hypothetical protein